MSGVNVDFTLEISKACGIPTIASGGVKDDSDIEALLKTGEIEGVIVGKAFYEGRIELKRFF